MWDAGRAYESQIELLDQLSIRDTLAERSKAVAQGAIPKGRGFEPHRCHFYEVARQCIASQSAYMCDIKDCELKRQYMYSGNYL